MFLGRSYTAPTKWSNKPLEIELTKSRIVNNDAVIHLPFILFMRKYLENRQINHLVRLFGGFEMHAIKLTVILAGFLTLSLPMLDYAHAGGKGGGHSYRGGGHSGGHSYRGGHRGGRKGGHRGGYRGHSPRLHGYGHRNYGYRGYGHRPYYGSSFFFGVSPYFNYNYYPRPYTYVRPTTVYVESSPSTESPLSEYSPEPVTTPSSEISCLEEREYQTKLTIDGQEVDAHGTACKLPDGSWRLNPPKN